MSRGRALLLEDDGALRDLLREALQAEGFCVIDCDSFVHIREAASRGDAEVVVADFWGQSQRVLPPDEREQIRELCSYLPVVLVTGRTWATDTSAEELGARALLRKPFDLETLLRTVATVLARGQV
jgi:two-component system nitrogen regulation response regulator GlnG